MNLYWVILDFAGAASQKNMLGPKPKKYEWANAEKTSWGKCPKKQVEHLMSGGLRPPTQKGCRRLRRGQPF